ncbi:hypothetical protein NHG24_07980 [Aerococcaceae bacterium NML210727]|nr:hypothetical protein [Aerococcaceae bacterium NML210727]MCW6655070.1 hypothetical protein [Aerococcaceae bacterium NML201296]
MYKEDIQFLQELRDSYWHNAFEHAYTNTQYAEELKRKAGRLEAIIKKCVKVEEIK